ncbi:MAG: hypothetical protein FWD42_04420, partial [Solirubrobacterales bacterium]|nr:hypothetical protein [Solirubrobacterales bacterium]
ALGGFDLAVDAPMGSRASQLWAAAGAAGETPPRGSAAASLTVMRDLPRADGEEAWSQLLPAPGVSDPLPGARLRGGGEELDSDTIAPEPGREAAWLSLRGNGQPVARVALLEVGACETAVNNTVPCARVAQEDSLPEAGEPIGPRGAAGPIVCPAARDCWMATFAEPASRAGWLFHYTDGAGEAADADPFFDGADGVITYRPPDQGVPVVYPDGFANDDSLANQQVIATRAGAPAEVPAATPAAKRKAARLVEHVRSRLIVHRRLVVSFTLTAEAHVQLTALRRKRVVARARRRTLRAGRHTISLELNPKRWPTNMRFEVKPAGGAGAGPPGGAGTGGEGGAGGAGAGGESLEHNSFES